MTKDKRLQLAARLRVLADLAESIGADMEFHGIPTKDSIKGRTLIAVSDDFRETADRIEKEALK